MEDTLKALLLVLVGGLIPPMWSKFLNKRKIDADLNLTKTDECQKNIDILKKVIEELRAEIDRMKSKMSLMAEINITHENSLKDQIRKLNEVNNAQSKEITELKVQIADMVVRIDAKTNAATAKKKSVKKAVSTNI